jgi:hypothetical protein
MTILFEGKDRFVFSAAAKILQDDREVAAEWAGKHVRKNPALKWIVGKYVEADRANSNNQFWSFADLRMAQPSVDYAPLNILHRPKHIVGSFVATEMVYPNAEGAAEQQGHPYIEALAAFWKLYFPEEFQIVEAAHNAGSLYFSMECVSQSVTCAGESGCGKEFAYAGPKSPSYCEHLNHSVSIKQLNQPHFLAGALIVPPERPGWKGAEVKEISRIVDANADLVEQIYKDLASSGAEEEEFESLMLEHLKVADVAGATRKPAVKKVQKSAEETIEEVVIEEPVAVEDLVLHDDVTDRKPLADVVAEVLAEMRKPVKAVSKKRSKKSS